ncbi:hypothetical protein SEPCBS119000_002966 [Sporothrix epigloea]|uniref:Ubiquitin carboxyl-terminal hydrolase n=1 Tax=Sporothrix epigloea TaxID=1892477 RepID=A0ABP0DJ25_9PEZI
MPEKALSVATYAAGASLATIALVYVFAPTYFIDNTPSTSNNPLSLFSGRKTGVVGLSNAANDCFINSVLQALAGLGDLRIYLIRETHRRKIDDVGVYQIRVPQDDEDSGSDGAGIGRRPMPAWKIAGLQAGLVSKGLKDMIDQLNERPIYRKTISAGPFVRVLETAFQQRISRQQQDAQEFLQIVAERLCDEYHAGRRARRYAKRKAEAQVSAVAPALDGGIAATPSASIVLDGQAVNDKLASLATAASAGESHAKLSPSSSSNGQVGALSAMAQQAGTGNEVIEEGFPMEGKIESQIECLTCGFKPRPSEQPFCTLTLSVPQTVSTSLSACFDSMLKTEYIDDFKCEKCRLVHAVQVLEAEAAQSKSESFRKEARHNAARLQQAIDTDPERPPPDIILPDARYAPKRRIARHFRLVSFPKVLAVHLSRSIYDASKQSQKNFAKVAFPEQLPLGSILHQRKYKLVSVVMHKGSHHSGHYESFRRQIVAPPYSNPHTFQPSHAYSPSSSPAVATPKIGSTSASLTARPVDGSSPVSSSAELPALSDLAADTNGGSSTVSLSAPEPAAANLLLQKTRSAQSSGSSGRAGPSAALPPAPTSAPGKEKGNENTDAAAETHSLRSITRSTLSRITTSSRSGSRGDTQGESPTTTTAAAAAAAATATADDKGKTPSVVVPAAPKPRPRKKKTPDRWWRISDEKVREASTKEVLSMQREVYLLFYDLERESYMGQ